MNWALWLIADKGRPEFNILVDRGDDAPRLTDYERRRALAAPVRLGPVEQWLSPRVLARLYPAPAQSPAKQARAS
jgi:hypothetical protein